MMSTPVGWGSTYCFTDVSVSVLFCVHFSITPITKVTPAQILLGGMFFPWALAFDFCYDLDLCSQVKL